MQKNYILRNILKYTKIYTYPQIKLLPFYHNFINKPLEQSMICRILTIAYDKLVQQYIADNGYESFYQNKIISPFHLNMHMRNNITNKQCISNGCINYVSNKRLFCPLCSLVKCPCAVNGRSRNNRRKCHKIAGNNGLCFQCYKKYII